MPKTKTKTKAKQSKAKTYEKIFSFIVVSGGMQIATKNFTHPPKSQTFKT